MLVIKFCSDFFFMPKQYQVYKDGLSLVIHRCLAQSFGEQQLLILYINKYPSFTQKIPTVRFSKKYFDHSWNCSSVHKSVIILTIEIQYKNVYFALYSIQTRSYYSITLPLSTHIFYLYSDGTREKINFRANIAQVKNRIGLFIAVPKKC